MHFLLVGPGALGCLLGFIISCGKTGDDRLTLPDYNADRADYISRQKISPHWCRTYVTGAGRK